MANKYKVTKAWGKHTVGEILEESREVRRKLREGGCLEKMAPESSKSKKAVDDAKNKMQPDFSAENKGDN